MTPPAAAFFRQFPDRTRQSVPWENQFAGADSSACWLIGGGPSLTQSSIQDIVVSPCPKMCTNLAGSGLLRPNFWTSYDPSVRFHRSIYLDPGVMKFVILAARWISSPNPRSRCVRVRICTSSNGIHNEVSPISFPSHIQQSSIGTTRSCRRSTFSFDSGFEKF